MKIITYYNNKGGVGKTTSVINVAYFLCKAGYKVLVVDCDSQSNSCASVYCGDKILTLSAFSRIS